MERVIQNGKEKAACVVITKTCTKCKNDFPATKEYFSRQRLGKYGVGSWCKKCRSNYDKEWKNKNRKRSNENLANYRRKLKYKAILNYGGKCVNCGEDNLDFLTMDHINNDGSVIKRLIPGQRRIYHWLHKNNYPSGFQILCFNCNFEKSVINMKLKKHRTTESNVKYRKSVKLKIMSHYGEKCSCCGESNVNKLTIDHINNDGAEHRRITGNGFHFYMWLKRNNFPQGFQVLCFNCNCGRHINGGICPHVSLAPIIEN